MAGPTSDRRRFLRLIGGGSAIALAGCLGNDTGSSGNSGTNAGGNDNGTAAQNGAKTNDSVPKQYETAKSLGGRRRDPDSLTPKKAVAYQSSTNGGHGCSGCEHFIPPKGDDDAGACVLVEGSIKPNAWCKLFSPK